MKTNLMRGLDKVRLPQWYSFLLQCGASFVNKYKSISSLYVCVVNIKLKYNFVQTPRKFNRLLALVKMRAYGSKALR